MWNSVIWEDVGFRHGFVLELAADARSLARQCRSLDDERRSSAKRAAEDWRGRYAEDFRVSLASGSAALTDLAAALLRFAAALGDASDAAVVEQARRERMREELLAEERRQAALAAELSRLEQAAAAAAAVAASGPTGVLVGI